MTGVRNRTKYEEKHNFASTHTFEKLFNTSVFKHTFQIRFWIEIAILIKFKNQPVI